MTEYHEFFHPLFQTTREYSKKMNEKLSGLGLYSAQWTVIYCLKKNGPSTQAELCHYLNVEAPTITRTISKLEQAGWIIKTPGRNNREKMIQLTDESLEKYPTWKEAITTIELEVMSGVSDADKKLVEATFHQMISNMKGK